MKLKIRFLNDGEFPVPLFQALKKTKSLYFLYGINLNNFQIVVIKILLC